MRRLRVFSLVALTLLLGVTMSACGLTGGDKSTNAPKGDPVDSAGIDSGCWTADQVSADEGEGRVSQNKYSAPPAMAIDVKKTYTALLRTNYGDIEIEFLPGDAPATVNSFVCLARDGYYANTVFHRIVKGFVVQGGDPTGTGAGGPGYQFPDEPIPPKNDYEKGTVAMANAGRNTNGSQFFICTADLKGRLPKNYTIFAKVISGMDVVDALNNVPTQRSGSGEVSAPVDPVVLESVTITES